MWKTTECSLAQGSGPGEKLYAQSSFLAVSDLGTVGIALADWWLVKKPTTTALGALEQSLFYVTFILMPA